MRTFLGSQAANTAGIVRELWPFDQEQPRAIVATGQRSQSAGGTLADKQAAAEELAEFLLVPDPAQVMGRRALIYDDVLTSCETLNVIAGALRRAGAVEVSGVVLARQPW
jgi:predicted amidophosphoribosyltransferase